MSSTADLATTPAVAATLTGAMSFAAPGKVALGGVLGDALAANHRGRLSHFIVDETSPAIALFEPGETCCNTEGDWYGEHAGKWLQAATRAAVRTGDHDLLRHVLHVADHLIALQDSDGYLGNYAPERRFTQPQPPRPESWDGAPALRTWDIWTHSYLMLGLLELARHTSETRYRDAAARIADLVWRTLDEGRNAITDLGNHFGLSASVVIDPAVELYVATGEQHHLDLARLVLDQIDREPRNALLSRALAGADASEIATGKAYQLLWNLVGIAKLHRATGDADYLRAVEHLWRNIRDHHLTLGGGPWGGTAHRSREVFNPAGVFSPYGYVETCSTMAWIQLNRELLAITGAAQYAQEIERTAYNDLLGAQAPNGEDWCYYSFPNGRRVHTTYWRCCKSSGAIALEELAPVAYGVTADGAIAVNLLGPSVATLATAAGKVTIEQRTSYPFDGAIDLLVTPERAATFAIDIRIPDWAEGATLSVNGAPVAGVVQGTYVRIERSWQAGDIIALRLPLVPRLHQATARNVQESLAPGGEPVRQEVLHFDYAAITLGPLVYATGLIDGFKIEETIRLPDAPAEDWLTVMPATGEVQGDTVRLSPQGREAIDYVPYYRAGGVADGTWRLTWLMLVPESSS
ncbi:MAG: prenyltransferase-like family protein [Sphingomonas bacterium]|uniref:glycoside hydrolase family 127 protein n=1 Tax=Sphingomonas bacterium TaxID=1895847 RepID=UPI002638977E|nr:beta-L-arabinofuranosidase domain-containing protein [Sphingomonas bacterium]MDB5708327.1 prenyltransferase-like family protein [Sphingomonas bacterium]